MTIERVARRFGLGRSAAPPERVAGGLSNEMWRVITPAGVFAVKRMIVNAGRPGFVANVEASYDVERRAFAAGVPMPAPVEVPGTGCALARVDGALFRAHRWVDGQPGAGTAAAAAALLANIHTVGAPRPERLPGTEWNADRWGADLAGLVRRVGGEGPGEGLVVDSHRDLDRKNTLTGPGGVLMAVDWDAAGPVGAVHEAVGVALDWSDGDPAVFRGALRAYRDLSGTEVPPEPWIFAGWLAAQGGWLDYQAARPGGAPHVTATLARLRELAIGLDALLGSVSSC